jgi:MFS family permease
MPRIVDTGRDKPIQLGIRPNLAQFLLLIVINAFVGGMVGLERTVVPLLGKQQFHLDSTSLITSFIVSFGITKGLIDLISGQLADRWGRKPVLVLGWLAGLPVPFLIMYAPNWSWIIAANVLLGINQGFAWSMTVLMKIDLAGPARRGLAMGLNEFAGYGAVGLTAILTGYIAASAGLRPKPFYLGIGYAIVGILLSLILVRETRGHIEHESAGAAEAGEFFVNAEKSRFWQVFAVTSWKNKTLFGICQAGLVNNLNDGVAWAGGQLVSGPLSDRWGRKGLIVGGMWIQALAHPLIALGATMSPWASGLAGAVLLGLGTAMVYPTLLALVGDIAHPSWRARSFSIYRFWRDMGYAVGAFLAGMIGDWLGLTWSIHVAGILTFASGLLAWLSIRETRRKPSRSQETLPMQAEEQAEHL